MKRTTTFVPDDGRVVTLVVTDAPEASVKGCALARDASTRIVAAVAACHLAMMAACTYVLHVAHRGRSAALVINLRFHLWQASYIQKYRSSCPFDGTSSQQRELGTSSLGGILVYSVVHHWRGAETLLSRDDSISTKQIKEDHVHKRA